MSLATHGQTFAQHVNIAVSERSVHVPASVSDAQCEAVHGAWMAVVNRSGKVCSSSPAEGMPGR